MGMGGDVFQNLAATSDGGTGTGTGTGTETGTGTGTGTAPDHKADPFHVLEVMGEGFAAAFGIPDGFGGVDLDNFGSMTLIDSLTNTFSFDMNGVDLTGDYHQGTPVANDPNAIAVP
jgi:hypothetical protein